MRKTATWVGVVTVLSAGVVGGCTGKPVSGSSGGNVASKGIATTMQPPLVGPAPGNQIPRCGKATASELTNYDELVAANGRFHQTEVAFERVWQPTASIDMPIHHATGLRWTNLESFPLLADSKAERLRFTFTPLSRTIQYQDNRHMWFGTHRAHVSEVCSTSAPSTRPMGTLPASKELDVSACAGLEAAVSQSARTASLCETDQQCTIEYFDGCSIDGLGCNWVAYAGNQDRYRALKQAKAAYAEWPCPFANCSCKQPPSEARCMNGLCVADVAN